MRTGVWFLVLGILCFSSCQQEVWETSDAETFNNGRKEVLWLVKSPGGALPTKAVGLKSKYWKIGDTIRIKFLSTVDEATRQKIQDYAAVWLEYANLTFKYVAPAEIADVKIGFGTDEDRWISWSAIGTDCKAIPQDQPSLTYSWLEDDPEAVIKSEIFKGIGLVLGLGFEHQNPNSTLTFKATADVAGEYNLTDEEAEAFKTLYSTSQTNYTAYDKSSVMMVALGTSMVSNRSMVTHYNSELSENDKAFISKTYPPLVATAVFKGKSTNICVVSTRWAPKPGPHNRIVDWGDGTIQVIDKDEYYGHSYPNSTVDWVIRFYGQDTAYRLLYTLNGVKEIDVTKAKSLETLMLWRGTLSSLDISQNLNLGYLSVETNDLYDIDISNNKKLYRLLLSGNHFSNETYRKMILSLESPTSEDRRSVFCVGERDDKTGLEALCKTKGWDFSVLPEMAPLGLNTYGLKSSYCIDFTKPENLWEIDASRRR